MASMLLTHRAEGSPNASRATSVCEEQSLEADGLPSGLILPSLGWPAENHTASQGMHALKRENFVLV